ncbi:MAG TPA: PA14 domain-containing protein [Polyangia bacterium]|jgi:hypothetical protein|nr:PA14 domain-containing protein [Polyangia bacterium]
MIGTLATSCMSTESAQPGSEIDAGTGTADDTPVVPVGGDKTRLGALCLAASDCESGFCADGVCCESACAGVCASCATATAAGQCVPAEAATDPRNDCAAEGEMSCGTDGECNGSGACRRYAKGTVCRTPSCTGATLTPAGRCDGIGTCTQAADQPCAPFRCGDNQCSTTCAGDGDCVAPATCQAGACGKKPVGAACAATNQCNSGLCEQGVCCAAGCAGACTSCALAGSEGTCTKIPVSVNALCPETCSASQPCAAPAVCGAEGFCGGLRAQYFNATDLTNPRLTRTDGTIDFDWGENPPDATLDKDTWSVQWLGRVAPRFTETYTFYTVSDDGARLWLNGQLLVDDWTAHAPVERSGTIALVAGQTYPIRMEFFNNLGGAVARLLWSSASEPKATIPTANFRP